MIQFWLLLSGLFKLSAVKGLPSEGQLKSTISEEPEGERTISQGLDSGGGVKREIAFTINIYDNSLGMSS